MQKKYNHGVVFGKFMPLHAGHEFLIDTAIKACNSISIIVCTLSSEPIDGELRYKWVQTRYENDNVNVYHLKEDWIPQEPNECEFPQLFYNIWSATIKSFVKEDIDAVFASEDYVYPMAHHMKCTPVLVDRFRKRYKISGTEVRNNPFKNFNFLQHKEVKEYYRKKILIIGSESTGKSTLSKKLSDYYNHLFGFQAALDIQEYAREWIDTNLRGDMDKLKFEHITHFGRTQNHLVRQSEYPIIISDTDAIVSSIFQEIYFGNVDRELVIETNDEAKLFDIVIFLQPDCEWVDDGQRNLSHKRQEFTHKIKTKLDKLHMNYVEVDGSWDNRFKKSVEIINKLIRDT